MVVFVNEIDEARFSEVGSVEPVCRKKPRNNWEEGGSCATQLIIVQPIQEMAENGLQDDFTEVSVRGWWLLKLYHAWLGLAVFCSI